LILWNHRWEYDKNPEAFFSMLEQLAEMGVAFRVAIAGESFRNQPEEFLAARERFRERIIHFGYATKEQYQALLQRSDIVVSTAIHEFFGIAVVEAIYAGCAPLLPNRLAYPELIPDPLHETFLYRTLDDAVSRLREWLEGKLPDTVTLREHIARFDWRGMAQQYDTEMEELVRLFHS
jgi:glycosyltransferase involved in cell wall biosynthesis